jgi:hypothetical protein
MHQGVTPPSSPVVEARLRRVQHGAQLPVGLQRHTHMLWLLYVHILTNDDRHHRLYGAQCPHRPLTALGAGMQSCTRSLSQEGSRGNANTHLIADQRR